MNKGKESEPNIFKHSVVFTVLKDGFILLEYRDVDLNDEHFGLTIVPGGGVEGGETMLQAALREINEEFSINPTSVVLLGSVDEEKKEGVKRYHIFVVSDYEGEIDILKTEDGVLLWAKFEDARKVCEHPVTRQILAIIESSLPR